jgi:extradiol dioxygenase family protein
MISPLHDASMGSCLHARKDVVPASGWTSIFSDISSSYTSHFGVVLTWDAWHELAARLRAAGVTFAIEPGIRFAGLVGEQATMFLYDPSGNALEFKAFKDPSRLFAR